MAEATTFKSAATFCGGNPAAMPHQKIKTALPSTSTHGHDVFAIQGDNERPCIIADQKLFKLGPVDERQQCAFAQHACRTDLRIARDAEKPYSSNPSHHHTLTHLCSRLHTASHASLSILKWSQIFHIVSWRRSFPPGTWVCPSAADSSIPAC